MKKLVYSLSIIGLSAFFFFQESPEVKTSRVVLGQKNISPLQKEITIVNEKEQKNSKSSTSEISNFSNETTLYNEKSNLAYEINDRREQLKTYFSDELKLSEEEIASYYKLKASLDNQIVSYFKQKTIPMMVNKDLKAMKDNNTADIKKLLGEDNFKKYRLYTKELFKIQGVAEEKVTLLTL